MIKTETMNQIKPNGDMNMVKVDDHLRKMFIGGLSPVTTEESLRNFYSQWGEVLDAVVMRDPTTRRSRGFGFITYVDTMMVDKAQASRPHVIDGKAVDSKRALPRPELGKQDTSSNSSVKKIFVGGLKDNHDEQSLIEHFSQFGNVVSVKILTDKTTGRKRGFAFVEFDDYDAVDKAVIHKNHTIKYVLVDVKKSVYKQELAKKLAAQQVGGMMVPQAGGAAGGYAQAAYNPHAYSYAPQMAPPPATYNSWGGYAQAGGPTYQQPQAAAPVGGYGAYGTPPPNAAAAAWNTQAYPAAAAWGQGGYVAQPAGAAPVAGTAAPTAANGWNNTSSSQNFGDYQQTYNGGPQKAGSLQTNRMNPYSVAAAPNYGYVNMYTTTSNNSQAQIKPLIAPMPEMSNGNGGGSALTAKKPRRPY